MKIVKRIFGQNYLFNIDKRLVNKVEKNLKEQFDLYPDIDISEADAVINILDKFNYEISSRNPSLHTETDTGFIIHSKKTLIQHRIDNNGRPFF